MKKVLIISELFYPSNNIGARRPTKIAQKLSACGYKVDVFTRYSFENTTDFCDNLFSTETRSQHETGYCVPGQKKHGKLYTAWGALCGKF